MRHLVCTDPLTHPFQHVLPQVDLLDDTIKGEETLNIFKARQIQGLHGIAQLVSTRPLLQRTTQQMRHKAKFFKSLVYV